MIGCGGLTALGRWPAGSADSAYVARHSAGICQGPAEQEFDLRVRAAHFVARPAGQRVVHGRVQPKQYRLAFRWHDDQW